MISELLRAFLSWALIFPAVFLAGSHFRRLIPTQDVILRGVFYFALGFAVLSYGIVLLDAFKLLHPSGVWTLLVLVLLSGIRSLNQLGEWLKEILNALRLTPSAAFRHSEERSGEESGVKRGSVASLRMTKKKPHATLELKVLKAMAIVSFAVLLCGTLTPEIGGDALTYHLNLPKVFLKQGSLAPNYFDLNSYFPLFLNNLYLIGLATGGVLSAKLFHFACGALLFISIQRTILKLTHHEISSWFFVLVFWLTPAGFNQLSTSYNDVALAFYVFLSLLSLIHGLEENRRSAVFLSGLLLGFAMAVKYIAMISFVGLMGIWIFQFFNLIFATWPVPLGDRQGNIACPLREEQRPSAILQKFDFKGKFAAIASFPLWISAFGLGCGYWLAKNWLLTGNPVFPYFGSLFGTVPYNTRYDSYGLGRGLWDFILVFWTMVRTPDAFGSFSSRIGLFYFLFLPFVILAAVKIKSARPYALFLFFFLIAWFFICQAHRYVLPGLPPLLVAAALGAFYFFNQAPAQMRSILRRLGLAAGLAGLSVYFAAGVYHYRHAYPLLAGRLSWDEFLVKMERTVPVGKWINVNLPQDANILIESEPRQFYIDRSIVRDAFLRYRTQYHLREWNSEELNSFLKARGITHVLASEPEGSVQTDGRGAPLMQLMRSSWAEKIYEAPSQNTRDEKYIYRLYRLK